MGLLNVLDSTEHKQEGVEIEYRLYSWGEKIPPFLGNREHEIAARFILPEFPFKLFSSSTPYDDPLPQKLCLTFKAPYEVKRNTKSRQGARPGWDHGKPARPGVGGL